MGACSFLCGHFHQTIGTEIGIRPLSRGTEDTQQAAPEACSKYAKQASTAVSEKYDPLIAEWEEKVRSIQDSGGNPERHYDLSTGETVNVVAIVDSLRTRKKEDEQKLSEEAVSKCAKMVKEAEEKQAQASDAPSYEVQLAQLIIDSAVLYYSEGWSAVLPSKMTHIDAKKIMDGYPLGGKNSHAVKVRDAVAGVLSGGDKEVEAWLKDPLKKPLPKVQIGPKIVIKPKIVVRMPRVTSRKPSLTIDGWSLSL